MPPVRGAFTKLVTTDTSVTSLVVGGEGASAAAASTGTGGIVAGNAALNKASDPTVAPLTLRGGGAIGAYTLVNSGVVFKDAAGVEIWRVWGTDPDDANFNASNLYIGCKAGDSQPTDNTSAGYYNLGIGTFALEHVTTGQYNLAIGHWAGRAATTAVDNVLIGENAGMAITVSTRNVLVGNVVASAMNNSDDNTAVGAYALEDFENGDQNCVIGAYALKNLAGATDSDANVAIGFESGVLYGGGGGTDLLVANQCVFVGAATRASANTAVNQVVIGYGAIGAGDNTVRIGNTSATAAYLPLRTFQGTRTAPMGEWTNQAFSAGDYTASSGNWTVDSGDVTTNRYMLVGKTVTWQLVIVNTDVSATPAELRVAVPGGLTEAALSRGGACGFVSDAGVAANQLAFWKMDGSGVVKFSLFSTGTWSTTTSDNTSITATIIFEIA